MIYLLNINLSFLENCNGNIKYMAFKDKEKAIETFIAYTKDFVETFSCNKNVNLDEDLKDEYIDNNVYITYSNEDTNNIVDRTFIADKHGEFRKYVKMQLITLNYENDVKKLYIVSDDCSFVAGVEDYSFEVRSDKNSAYQIFEEWIKTAHEDFEIPFDIINLRQEKTMEVLNIYDEKVDLYLSDTEFVGKNDIDNQHISLIEVLVV